MTPETPVSVKADHTADVPLHEEIKRRAYELYEQRGQIDGHDLEHGLKAELPRVLYAATELEKDANGRARDIPSVRAARVYLRALRSCLEEQGERSRSLR